MSPDSKITTLVTFRHAEHAGDFAPRKAVPVVLPFGEDYTKNRAPMTGDPWLTDEPPQATTAQIYS
jgi:hypothetical protein